MPARNRLIEDVVDLWYGAGFGERSWPEVLQATAELLGGAGSAFFDLDRATGRIGQFHLFRLEQGADEYVERMNLINPRMRHSLERDGPHMVTDYEILSERALSRHEFYDWMERTNDTRYFVGGRLLDRGARSVFASVEFSRRRGHADENTAAVFHRLVPHIANAGRIAAVLQHSGEVKGLADRLMSLHGCGVVTLGRDGRVLAMNVAAQATIALRDGLLIENGYLRTARAATDRSLRALIGGIVGGHARGPSCRGGALAVPRPSGRLPFALRAVPCPRTIDGGWNELPAAVVLIANPDQRPVLGHQTLQALGFSPAEARVAQQLANGLTLIEAARAIGTSHNTARAHLRSIFAKTHTRSQVELVSILAEFSRIDEGLSPD